MTKPIRTLQTLSKSMPICVIGISISEPFRAELTLNKAGKDEMGFQSWQKYSVLNSNGYSIIRTAPFPEKGNEMEYYRKLGAAIWEHLKENNESAIQLLGSDASHLIAFAEGLWLRNYRFELYKKDTSKFGVTDILIDKTVSAKSLKMSWAMLQGTAVARDLVNEPANVLTATELAKRITKAGKTFGFNTTIFEKSKIKSLKMGGLLSVNQGSTKPPTFSVMEYKPSKALNKNPIVLVGKGIVYDTGGLSLKPTPNSMDIMKCDMAGAAAIVGLFCAAANAGLPFHLVGLIPATDNQPGPDAYAPGDVIEMYSGAHVEVMNTDAEGRLVLADALAYAKKYKPELVIDLATLTGSAINALGTSAAALMGTADPSEIRSLIDAGFKTWERCVELPLWDDYAEGLESDIADMRNLAASPQAGAIVAGKFLEKFTDYPWMHLDIAGPAFLPAATGYLPKGATGYGVHLLFQFLKNRAK